MGRTALRSLKGPLKLHLSARGLPPFGKKNGAKDTAAADKTSLLSGPKKA